MMSMYNLGRWRMAAAGLVIALAVGACAPAIQPEAAPAGSEPRVLTVATHDSFAVSDEVLSVFETAHNARVQFLQLGDAGEALNKIILSKDAPLADVFFGTDNSFLTRALAEDVFEPHASPLLGAVPDVFELDPEQRLLPVDHGYVTLNADKAWYAERGLALPDTLEDLIDPAYANQLVVENPATSSPGLAFLLATIAELGEEGWQPFWAALRENGTIVAQGWTEAYYERFTVGSGGTGDRPLVVSYASSPPADVVFATDGRAEPASVNVNLDGGVFQQIEFVGVLKGAKQPELARAWVDFMLDLTFQNDIPLQMFVYPVNEGAALPDLFLKFAPEPDNAAEMDAASIDANRERWIAEWTEIMLR